MKIQEIINLLESNKAKGFQIEKRNGILSSTWLIYKKDGFYFYFDINQKIEFIERYKYSQKELIEEFKNSVYKIDFSID